MIIISLHKSKWWLLAIAGMIVLSFASIAFADPPASPYTPGQTLNPTCAPTDVNCTVSAGVIGNGTSTQITFWNSSSSVASDANLTWNSSTQKFAATNVSSTNISSTNITASGYGTFPTLNFTNASGTNISVTGYGTFPALTFTSASGTNQTLSGYFIASTTGTFGTSLSIGTTTQSGALNVVGSSNFSATSTFLGNLMIGTSTAASNALLTIATSSNIFTVLANGNVGIGTANPGAQLEVAGAVSSTKLTFPSAGGATQGLFFGTRNFVSEGTNDFQIGNGTGDTVTFGTGADVRAGNSTGFDWVLSRNAITTQQSGIEFGAQSVSPDIFIGRNGVGNLLFQAGGHNTYLTIVSSTGNVGIGTTQPSSTLHVIGSSIVSGSSTVLGISSTSQLYANSSTISMLYVSTSTIGTSTPVAGALLTIATTSNILTVLANGNVGIGTTAPAAKLSVQGNNLGDAIDILNSNGRLEATLNLTGGAQEGILDLYDSGGILGMRFLPRAGFTSYINVGSLGLGYTASTNAELVVNGNVGIGTSAPVNTLDVSSTADIRTSLSVGTTTQSGALNVFGSGIPGDTAVATFSNATTTDSASTTVLRLNLFSNASGTTSRFIQFFASSTTPTNGVGVGHIGLGAGGSVVYTSGGADFAENFKVAPGVTLSPGDIAAIDENGKATLASPTESSIAGVVSQTAGFIGNLLDQNSGANHAVVGLLGQIATRVSIEGGSIRPGDPISLSSISGVGKKAGAGERVLGTAMQALNAQNAESLPCEIRDGVKVCFINVLVNSGWGTLPAQSGLHSSGSGATLSSSDSGFGSFGTLANFAASVKGALGSFAGAVQTAGDWIVGKITATFVKTDVIQVEKGITMKDQATGSYYCVTVTNGNIATTPGACAGGSGLTGNQTSASTTSTQSSSPPADQSTSSTSGTTDTSSSITVSATTTISESPATTTPPESPPQNVSSTNP